MAKIYQFFPAQDNQVNQFTNSQPRYKVNGPLKNIHTVEIPLARQPRRRWNRQKAADNMLTAAKKLLTVAGLVLVWWVALMIFCEATGGR